MLHVDLDGNASLLPSDNGPILNKIPVGALTFRGQTLTGRQRPSRLTAAYRARLRRGSRESLGGGPAWTGAAKLVAA